MKEHVLMLVLTIVLIETGLSSYLSNLLSPAQIFTKK